VILTAAYILWTLQRVYLGPEYKGPHGDHLTPMTSREVAIAVPILAFAILFGVYPQAIFHYMTPSVDQTVDDLATWSDRAQPDKATADRSGATAGLPSSAASLAAGPRRLPSPLAGEGSERERRAASLRAPGEGAQPNAEGRTQSAQSGAPSPSPLAGEGRGEGASPFILHPSSFILSASP
jgi:hypothetical protein